MSIITLLLVIVGVQAYFLWNNGKSNPKVDHVTIEESEGSDSLVTDSLRAQEYLDSLKNDSVSSFDQIIHYLDMLDTASELSHAKWGFSVYDIAADTEIVGRHQKVSLVPASIMKIVTTGTALSLAGADYTFPTTIFYDGKIDEVTGILDGNIYIRGSGDPTLGSFTFPENGEKVVIRKWIKAIEALGIRKINGAVIADARHFELGMIPAGWAWEDMQGEYCAGASGLSFRENICAMKFSLSSDSLICTSNPTIPSLNMHNELVEVKKGRSQLYVSGIPYSCERFVRGIWRKSSRKQAIKTQIPDPPGICAYLLFKQLKESGVEVRDSSTSVRMLAEQGRFEEYSGTKIITTYSPPLSKIVQHTNEVSQNFYAESILKLIAVHYGETGSTFNGTLLTKRFWKEKGLDMTGFYMADGSGLSRNNAFTAEQLTKMLSLFKNDSTLAFKELYSSLPIAGRTGTLKRLLKGTAAEDNVHAKSGSMRRVKSYAGYVTDRGGRMLAFTMMANDFSCANWKMRLHWTNLMQLMAELEPVAMPPSKFQPDIEVNAM